ncbi:MAG: N-acyl homoserine lactonase family protein [Pseudomonadota bacterium]
MPRKNIFRKTLARTLLNLAVVLSGSVLMHSAHAQQPQASGKVRMYLLDGGQINGLDPAEFNFKREEVKETDFVVTSELIVHPNGVLLWEAGAVPDHELPADGSTFTEGPVIVTKSLASQLAAIGYSMDDVDFFAMSHLHSDHNGNANDFAKAKWIVQKADRDMMFAGKEVRIMVPAYFAALKDADTLLLDNEDHDVFADGSVRIISAPGHTPGHQVLLVNLVDYGPVLLAGDLYHYPEEIETGRTPTFEYDPATSAISRAKIQALLKETGAKMWIGHDKMTHAALKFAPEYYE